MKVEWRITANLFGETKRSMIMSVANDNTRSASVRRPWITPELSSVGTVGDVLRGGGGKVTVVEADTGDTPRWPKGQQSK
jgi:hypothetical protein